MMMTIYNETPYRDQYWLVAVQQNEPYEVITDSANYYVASGEHYETCRQLVLTLNQWLERFADQPVDVRVKRSNGRQHWAVETFDCHEYVSRLSS